MSRMKTRKRRTGSSGILRDLKKGVEPDYASVLLNLLLVLHDAREAFLLEEANLKTVKLEKILALVRSSGLVTHLDPISVEGGTPPRHWVVKPGPFRVPRTDEEVGKRLGMRDPGSMYFDFTRPRTFLTIREKETGAEVTAEILLGEGGAYGRDKAKEFTEAMEQAGLPYRFKAIETHDDGTHLRARRLREGDRAYVFEHAGEYQNDLTNILPEHHVLVSIWKTMIREKRLLKKWLPVFDVFYRWFRPDKDMGMVEEKVNRAIVRVI